MKKSKEYHMNIGGASIILLLVVFALTVFAVLSVRASYHEMKLADKTREYIEAYYSADAKAEEIYRSICLGWADCNPSGDFMLTANEVINTSEYHELMRITNGTLCYTVPVDENRNINVQLTPDDDGLKITSWRLSEYESELYFEDDELIWDGGLTE